MTIKLCVIMDPIESIHVKKDTTFALLLEAQKKQWEIYYLQPKDLCLMENGVYAFAKRITLQDTPLNWVNFIDTAPQKVLLHYFDVVLMRKDPPFNLNYIYTTYLLEIAQKAGAFIINNPASIRDANEKLFAAWFPECCPETLVTSNIDLIHDFLNTHQKIIVKRLNSMGGDAVFALEKGALNINATLEVLIQTKMQPIMAQRYIPEITQGDKRILMIDGEPYPYALSRIPSAEDFRGNLAKGATGIGSELTVRDRWICERIGKTLKEKGLFFVGLDVIGDYLTEINVTSPTCVREIEQAFQINICAHILEILANKIVAKPKHSR